MPTEAITVRDLRRSWKPHKERLNGHAAEHPTNIAVVTASGLVRPINEGQGDLAIDKVKFGQLGVTLENQGPIRAKFTQGEFSLEPATFIAPSTQIEIAGGASLAAGLAFELNGSLDLSILPSFTPLLNTVAITAQIPPRASSAADTE